MSVYRDVAPQTCTRIIKRSFSALSLSQRSPWRQINATVYPMISSDRSHDRTNVLPPARIFVGDQLCFAKYADTSAAKLYQADRIITDLSTSIDWSGVWKEFISRIISYLYFGKYNNIGSCYYQRGKVSHRIARKLSSHHFLLKIFVNFICDLYFRLLKMCKSSSRFFK